MKLSYEKLFRQRMKEIKKLIEFYDRRMWAGQKKTSFYDEMQVTREPWQSTKKQIVLSKVETVKHVVANILTDISVCFNVCSWHEP